MKPATVHVCLVSDHLLPNLIPVLMDRPDLVWLVATKKMTDTGMTRRLQRLLDGCKLTTRVRDQAPSADLPAILDFATDLAAELADAHQSTAVTLNATGGNKLMALAFVQVFRDLLPGVNIVYTDTANNRLELLTERATRPMSDVVDLPLYLAAYGLTYRGAASDDPAWQDTARERKPLTRWLAAQAGALDEFFGALNWLVHKAMDQKGRHLYLKQPRQEFRNRPQGRSQEAMERIAQAGLLDWDSGRTIELPDLDAARYLGGVWLEEYAWHVVHDEGLGQVAASVTGTWEGNKQHPSRNEFDLLAVHANRLLVVECKTSLFGRQDAKDSDVLYKLQSLGRNAGGLFGRSLLLSARPLSDAARERARSQHLAVIEGEDLPRLRDFVRDWVSQGG